VLTCQTGEVVTCRMIFSSTPTAHGRVGGSKDRSASANGLDLWDEHCNSRQLNSVVNTFELADLTHLHHGQTDMSRRKGLHLSFTTCCCKTLRYSHPPQAACEFSIRNFRDHIKVS
jgi:hypothetical protein